MSFISILLALLLEQAKPLSLSNPVYHGVRNWVRWCMRNYDAGKPHFAWLAWCLAVLVPTVLAAVIHWVLLARLGWVAAVVWNIVILYCTLGFRQFSHHFTQIRDALLDGNEDEARKALARWMRIDAADLPRSEILRHVIEFSIQSAHRHMFGVFLWYSLLAACGLGPTGAVLYRLTEFVLRFVNKPRFPSNLDISPAAQANANLSWYVLDWLACRVTALSFAFVGSFEDAVDSWRQFEAKVSGDNDGVVLAATSGAINVRLREPVSSEDRLSPELSHLRSVVGLVWRTVVMWMVVLALLTLARLLG